MSILGVTSADSPCKVSHFQVDDDLLDLLIEYTRKRVHVEGGSRSSKINDFLRRHEVELKEMVEA